MDYLEEAYRLFGDEPRPGHFTDHKHCEECAEHDETLRLSDRERLTHDDVRPGWSPLCFVSNEGFRYYFPALVRLALDGSGDDYFIGQLIFHLEHDGKNNDRFLAFSPIQRAFVVKFLHHLVETRAQEIDNFLDTDAVFRAIAVWEEDGES